MDNEHTIKHGLGHRPDGYNIACTGLTRAEAVEILMVIRRLELFRLMGVDADTVENGARTMAEFEAHQAGGDK